MDNLKDLFERFLRYHGVLRAFKHNVSLLNYSLKYDDLWLFYSCKVRPYRILAGVFNWADSKGGYEFWDRLSYKWSIYFDNNKQKCSNGESKEKI